MSSPFVDAAEDPVVVTARATGLFADGELDFLGGERATMGLILTVLGGEASVVLPIGWSFELGGELLLSLAGGGWAVAARTGWELPLHGRPGAETNRLYGTFTPLVGVRFGEIPHSSTSDGYYLSSSVFGPQAGVAYDLRTGLRRLGFATRLFAMGNLHAYSEKRQDELAWDYASGDPSLVSLELGVSFGFTIPVR